MLSPVGPAEQDEGGSRPRSISSWERRTKGRKKRKSALVSTEEWNGIEWVDGGGDKKAKERERDGRRREDEVRSPCLASSLVPPFELLQAPKRRMELSTS